MKKVYIVGPDHLMNRMFLDNSWKIVTDPEDADLIQFTGGEDVDPSYYGDIKHSSTYSNPQRDAQEALVYNTYVGKKPMAGICRGGQLLNVLNGGKMFQHVTNHGLSKGHPAFDVVSAEVYHVTSVHHQMMIPSEKATLLLFSEQKGKKYNSDGTVFDGDMADVEALFYKDTNSLCFQPHPEYVELEHPCQRLYFNYLNKFFNL